MADNKCYFIGFLKESNLYFDLNLQILNNPLICSLTKLSLMFLCKNFKEKLHKTKAAILYNKICRIQHLTPKYISIKVNGHNNIRTTKKNYSNLSF
jgi:hypothetical protein